MSAFQQVGNFEVVNVNGQLQKNGGNVAGYFCTPRGHVLHATAGPIPPHELLDAAKWAVQLYHEVAGKTKLEQLTEVSLAHQQAVQARVQNWQQHHARRGLQSNQGRVHGLLAKIPLALLESVYKPVFEEILNERTGVGSPSLELAERQLALAEQSKRPLLFVLHTSPNNDDILPGWQNMLATPVLKKATLKALVKDFVVVPLPVKELPALSQRLGQPPYQAPNNTRPLFVVARSDGTQLAASTGWHNVRELAYNLAGGTVDAIKQNPPAAKTIRDAARFLGQFDPQFAAALTGLSLEKAEQEKAEQEKAARDKSDRVQPDSGKVAMADSLPGKLPTSK